MLCAQQGNRPSRGTGPRSSTETTATTPATAASRTASFLLRPKSENLALSERRESGIPSAARRLRYVSARPARGSGVGSPGRRIDARKGVGNSAPRETFRTGCRKARAESRFRWRTKRQPVRGTLSPFEPPPRAAVPVDAPAPVDIQVGIAARDPADETARKSIRLDSAHLFSLYRRDLGWRESSRPLLSRQSVPRGRSRRLKALPEPRPTPQEGLSCS
jgi:hypothetical protein